VNPPDAPTPSTSRPAKASLLSSYGGASVVLALTAINVAVFVLELLVDGHLSALMLPKTSTVMVMGANYGPATLHEGRIETLLTSCFLHFGLLHIGFNMVALKQIGPFVERVVGAGRFAVMYVLTGMFGSLVSASWGPFVGWVGRTMFAPGSEVGEALMSHATGAVSAGASGAICGVIGAALVIGVRSEGWRSPLARGTARWLGTVVLFGLFFHFDNAAHLGGAASGALIAAFWRRRPESPRGRVQRLAFVIVLGIGAAALVARAALTNPYAALTARDRLMLAESLAQRVICAEARDALAAAVRLVPQAAGDLVDPLPGCANR
jgi:rhomboid protease GluP